MIFTVKKIKLTVRLDEKQYAHLKEQAKISGFKMEPFIRSLIMGSQIKPRPPDEIIKLYRELSAIGNNINQLAYKANGLGVMNVEEVKKMRIALEKIWDKVVEL